MIQVIHKIATIAIMATMAMAGNVLDVTVKS